MTMDAPNPLRQYRRLRDFYERIKVETAPDGTERVSLDDRTRFETAALGFIIRNAGRDTHYYEQAEKAVKSDSP